MTPSPLELAEVQKVADTLPPGPRLLAELNELLLDPNSDNVAVTSLLNRDGALTSGIIRMANSLAFRRGGTVGTLDAALLRVGFQQVYTLVGLASAAQFADMPLRFYPVTTRTLRQNGLMSALLMEELAAATGLAPRPAYTAGLLTSLGMIALDLAAQRSRDPLALPPMGDDGIIEWEKRTFGLTSTEAAAHLLKTWKFPPEVFVAVRDHRLVGLAVDPLPEAKPRHVAAAQTDEEGFGLPGEQPLWSAHAAQAWQDLALDDERMKTATARARARFEKLRSAIE